VHTYGDTSDNCWGTGGHWNPLKVRHGSPSNETHHYGDMGNLVADENGFADFTFYSNELTLIGPYSIIGRGVNVHTLPDDYGVTSNYFS